MWWCRVGRVKVENLEIIKLHVVHVTWFLIILGREFEHEGGWTDFKRNKEGHKKVNLSI